MFKKKKIKESIRSVSAYWGCKVNVFTPPWAGFVHADTLNISHADCQNRRFFVKRNFFFFKEDKIKRMVYEPVEWDWRDGGPRRLDSLPSTSLAVTMGQEKQLCCCSFRAQRARIRRHRRRTGLRKIKEDSLNLCQETAFLSIKATKKCFLKML